MNELKIFNNNEFGDVRTLTIDNNPWFVGKDVAEKLGYKNVSDALLKHVDSEDKGVAKCDTLGGLQEMTVINESGLYGLTLSSKLPNAKKFKRWVTSEVIPQIRKSGSYQLDASSLSPELQLMNTMIQQLNRQALDQKRLEASIQETRDEVKEANDDLRETKKVMEIRPYDNWRDETNNQINKICVTQDDYKDVRSKIYSALDKRAGTNLKTRLNHLKNRALGMGTARSKVDKLTRLDVISEDKKLIEIYTAIVKEMAIKNSTY